jgi:glutathione S-transferase
VWLHYGQSHYFYGKIVQKYRLPQIVVIHSLIILRTAAFVIQMAMVAIVDVIKAKGEPMKLFYTERSPYARKVRVVAAHHGLPLEIVEVQLRPIPPELSALNPLAKVPSLALDSGELIADSPVICAYLDGIGTQATLLPVDALERARISTLEAIADGILDSAVAIVLEHLLRPETTRDANVIKKHADTMARGVVWLATQLPALQTLHLGSIAVAVALDYVRNRMGDYGITQTWATDQPELTAWLDAFIATPHMAATAPKSWSY